LVDKAGIEPTSPRCKPGTLPLEILAHDAVISRQYISYVIEVVGLPTGMTGGHAVSTPEISKMAETKKPRLVGRGS
jgi:hypothetical protein